jgi:hypothetical protein
VDGLGHCEERVVPAHEVPVGYQREVAEQRDLGAQDLRDTTAVRRGADVQHARAAQRGSKLAQRGDCLGARIVQVAIDGLCADVDGLKHASRLEASPARSRRDRRRTRPAPSHAATCDRSTQENRPLSNALVEVRLPQPLLRTAACTVRPTTTSSKGWYCPRCTSRRPTAGSGPRPNRTSSRHSSTAASADGGDHTDAATLSAANSS